MIGQEVRMTAAEEAAHRNWEDNARALSNRQAALLRELRGVQTEVEWVFGRDGALTAREVGRWWSGSSLPRRSAQRVLAKLEVTAPVACFLGPTHAQQVRVALETMRPSQALVVASSNVRDLRVMMECENFEREIDAGRLWFAWGADWPAELGRLLKDNEGLAAPGQFIRTHLTEAATVEGMIGRAEPVIREENARRAARVKELFDVSGRIIAAPRRVAVVAPSQFRLWDDAGHVLARLAQCEGWAGVDPDRPETASAVALAKAAAGCGGVLAANAGRADLPAGLPAQTRVITWATCPRLPRYDARFPNDRLLVTDPAWRDAARGAGWPEAAVAVATWPTEKCAAAPAPGTPGAPGGPGTTHGLALIADTLPLAAPQFDLSSQTVLWEQIAVELADEPFQVRNDVSEYLGRWTTATDVAEETLDRRLFVERLIVPAYQQGLARLLIGAGIDLKLFGRGWGAIDEFKAHARGEIAGREELRRVIDSCAALVHAWPAPWAHAVDAAGKPVLRWDDDSRDAWLRRARRLVKGEAPGKGDAATPPAGPELSGEIVRTLLEE